MSVGRFAASAPLARLLPGAGPSGRTRQIPPSRLSEDEALLRLSRWGFFLPCICLDTHMLLWVY